MKPKRFKVLFDTGEIEVVEAFSQKTAKILAQARQIQKGNRYCVSRIQEVRQ